MDFWAEQHSYLSTFLSNFQCFSPGFFVSTIRFDFLQHTWIYFVNYFFLFLPRFLGWGIWEKCKMKSERPINVFLCIDFFLGNEIWTDWLSIRGHSCEEVNCDNHMQTCCAWEYLTFFIDLDVVTPCYMQNWFAVCVCSWICTTFGTSTSFVLVQYHISGWRHRRNT